jgi:general secretion pathway protein D
VSPLVSTQFNYADVGLKLNITPQIHSSKECTLHIEVEVSEVDQYVNIGGISQPVIGQSKNTADVRLRDGEVNLLSGLSQNSDSTTVGGLPGLTNVPILGQFLFGSSSKTKTTGELMIALIPHIIRTPDYTAENLRGIYAGSDQVVKLYYSPKPEEAAPATPPVANPANPVAANPVPVNPAAPPATVPQLLRPGTPGLTAPATAPAGKAQVKFAPAAVEVKQGEPVNVSVQIDNAADLFSASPIRIKYDPAMLKLNDATPGEMFTRDGVHITSVKDIRNEVGEATVTIARAPGAKGVSGTGAVLMLNFTAIGKGVGKITLPELGLKNSQVQPVEAGPAELPVKVN